jgi:hypothetical protein
LNLFFTHDELLQNQALFDQAAERDLAKGKKQDDVREI